MKKLLICLVAISALLLFTVPALADTPAGTAAPAGQESVTEEVPAVTATPQPLAENVGNAPTVVTSYGAIDKDGSVSTEINEGITWLKACNKNESVWIGLDNSAGVFAKGSLLWASYDEGKYQIWTEDPNGSHAATEPVNVYVQLSDRVDAEDADELLTERYSDTKVPVSVVNIQSPEGVARFACAQMPAEGLAYRIHYISMKGDLLNGVASMVTTEFSDNDRWLTVTVLAEFVLIVILIIALIVKGRRKE